MNLSDITTQPYILALFKRDDGQRFLLGSGAYEFKESQQHFVANAMVNDVVEVQGSDGALLAGQVRRASVQSFDGYIGDGGVIKSSVENYRKNFIAYFQKNHLFTVIYIFADGTAIQRKRGYIVDAPEVKELYQMTPEYHIAMNFEDVNYYKYAEDSEGGEIYSNYVNVTSATTSSGGLIWDTGGESSVTAEGTQFNIYGTIAGTALDSFTLKGQTVQQTYTGKNKFDDTTATDTQYGLTVSGDTNGFTVNGTVGATEGRIFIGEATLPAGTYTVMLEYLSGLGQSKGWLYTTKTGWTRPTTVEMVVSSSSTQLNTTFTLTGQTTIYYGFYAVAGRSYTDFKARMSIVSGSTADFDYEPYVGGTASPNPDYPQNVQVVTGEQKITIGDGGENSDIFTVDLGSIELCKIGDYQDYIYKSNGDWYVHKETKKDIYDGSESWSYVTEADHERLVLSVPDAALSSWTFDGTITEKSDQFEGVTWRTLYNAQSLGLDNLISGHDSGHYIVIYSTKFTSASDLTTWLGSNNLTVYYALATATDTQITDASLITELDGLLQTAECYDGVTTFRNEAQTAGSVPGWMVVEVTTGSGGIIWDNIGATWEEGGEGGDTYVTVDSITNVFPTITINGPAYNPKITNVTTGQIIQYNGNVNGSQKLIIDIEQKTAKLSGTSVISNISGDWLYLTPGVNRLTYTIDNADNNYATIEWQEITG